VKKVSKQAFQIAPQFRERIWGRHDLTPFFDGKFEKPIGEVWFDCGCPILVKFIFTSQRLSVQVHPDDEYAQRHHGSLGKTEAWYVLDAQAPGEIAVGFTKPISREELRVAAETGGIENLLDWRRVKPGDVIFTPAGTVHAIGAGVTICEIQENSDITYRLYDYGRPRELHLDHGVEVSRLGPHEFAAKPVRLAEGREELVVSEYFRVERLSVKEHLTIPAGSLYYLILINTNGAVWFVPPDNEEFTADRGEWLLTYKSETPVKVTLS
jgi:mannose-6-phosphate isomerase